MNLEDKSKEELINLVRYYKSEWENVTRLCITKNRKLTELKKEIKKIRKEKGNKNEVVLYEKTSSGNG